MARFTRTYSPETREQARALRHTGFSYSEIIAELGGDIPKNTIQGWVRDIALTTEQQERIKQKELEARTRGQLAGAQWNYEQKLQRLQVAEEWAEPITEQVLQNREALLMTLAALWLGEGEKRDDVLGLANSDPRIIKGWVAILRLLFAIDEDRFSCQVLISEGMPEQELKEFWSDVTGIAIDRFQKSSVDTRKKTVQREGYKGVCRVLYFSAALRRQLGALAWQVLAKFDDKENKG